MPKLMRREKDELEACSHRLKHGDSARIDNRRWEQAVRHEDEGLKALLTN